MSESKSAQMNFDKNLSGNFIQTVSFEEKNIQTFSTSFAFLSGAAMLNSSQ